MDEKEKGSERDKGKMKEEKEKEKDTPIAESENMRQLLDRLFDHLHKPSVLRRKGSDETNELFNLLNDYGMVLTGSLRSVTDISEREKVCQALVDFFESRGQVSKLLRNAIDREVKKTENRNQLFVTNSFDSKIVSFYIHRVGKDYLRDTLSPFVERMISETPNLEIDPLKIAPGESLDEHLFDLVDSTQKLLDTIFTSIADCPGSILEVCEAIHHSVVKRYPERRHAAVGNFIFLRFFIPALTAPYMYGVINEPPDYQAGRALLLVAKCIQSLVNRVHTSGFKGIFNELVGMEKLSEFVIRNLNSLINFFDDMSIVSFNSDSNVNGNGVEREKEKENTSQPQTSPRDSSSENGKEKEKDKGKGATTEADIRDIRDFTIDNIQAVGHFLATDPYATSCEEDWDQQLQLKSKSKSLKFSGNGNGSSTSKSNAMSSKSAGFLQLHAKRQSQNMNLGSGTGIGLASASASMQRRKDDPSTSGSTSPASSATSAASSQPQAQAQVPTQGHHDHYAYYEGHSHPHTTSHDTGEGSSKPKPKQSLMHRRLDKLTDCVANPGYCSQRLQDLLLEPDLAVALTIGDTCPENQRGQIAKCLAGIFEANGQAMHYIPSVVDRELQLHATADVFLRGNTMTSKVLGAYSKLIGLDYIRATLRDPIQKIMEMGSKYSTEIDPSKIQIQLKSSESGSTTSGSESDEALTAKKKEILRVNNNRLSRVAQDLFDAIRNSVSSMPASLRRLSAHIQQVTHNHFSDLRISPVGVFLFMRFICPAIVTPENYGAVDTAPDATARRTLVLAAKLLQHLASTPRSAFGREEYMQAQEVFVNDNRDAVDLLFRDVIDLKLLPRVPGVSMSASPSMPAARALDVVECLSTIHRYLISNIDRVGDALPTRRPGEHAGEERALRFEKLLLAPGLGLCSALCSISKKENREMLTSAIVRVFGHHKQAVRLIKGAIRRELLYTSDVNSIVLENSVCTMLITKFFHHIGSEYLRNTLGNVVQRLINDPSGYEIEPRRLEAGESASENIQRLMTVSQEIVDSIFKSVSQAPIGLREICQFLQINVAERDPQHRYSFIGAFLFLRFFGPALISPELYGVTDSVPSEKSRRTLILIAKTIQLLANRAQIGTKEGYMREMNRFIISNLIPTLQFFDNLVETGTAVRVAAAKAKIGKGIGKGAGVASSGIARTVDVDIDLEEKDRDRDRSGTGNSSQSNSNSNSNEFSRRERSFSDKTSPESILRKHLAQHYARIAELLLSEGDLEWDDDFAIPLSPSQGNNRHTVALPDVPFDIQMT